MKKAYTYSILILVVVVSLYYMKSDSTPFIPGAQTDFTLGVTAGSQAVDASGQRVDAQGTPIDASQYADSGYHFTFKIPKGYAVTAGKPFDGGDGLVKTITIEQKGIEGSGVQIVISPFDEPGSAITASRIMADIPGLHVTGATAFHLGSGLQEATGLSFSTDDPNWGGASREVWFEKGGDLYQVSTYAQNAALSDEILSTWVFE